MRAEKNKNDRFPYRVENAEPEDEEMYMGEEIESVTCRALVNPDQDEWSPGEAEDNDEDEGHDMSRVGQVFGESGSVLLVMYRRTAPNPSHHGEDVAVSVDDGDDRGPQDEDCQGGRVGGHIFPVQEADEGVSVEPGLVEAKQRRAAHHRRGDPCQRHPALASDLSLYRVIPVSNVSIQANSSDGILVNVLT